MIIRSNQTLMNWIVILFAAMTVAILVDRYINIFEISLNRDAYIAPREGRFGKDCLSAVGQWTTGDTFETVRSRHHNFVPTLMPYGSITPSLIVPAGGYLIAKCPMDLSRTKASGFGWIVLQRLVGESAVYFNGRKVLEQDDGLLAGFPVPPHERLASSELLVISRGEVAQASRPGMPSASVHPFFTIDRKAVDGLSVYRGVISHESQSSLMVYAGISLLFGMIWMLGMRFPDVGWTVVFSSIRVMERSMFFDPSATASFTPGGADLSLFLNGMSCYALPAFVFSFYRKNFTFFSPLYVFLFGVLLSFITSFLLPVEFVRRFVADSWNLAGGCFLMGVVAILGGLVIRSAPQGRRWRIALMILLSALISFAYAGYLLQYNVTLSNYSKMLDYLYLGMLVLFSAFLIYDLILYRRSYLVERIARVEAQRRAATNDAIAHTTQMLAHDIRKPFSMLKMATQMIAKESDPEGVRRIAAQLVPEIQRSMQAVSGMIADVMDIGGTADPVLEVVSPASLIESSLTDSLRYKDEASISLDVRFDHYTSLKVDPLKISRVLTNIIENAVQAMKGKGALTVTTSQSSSTERLIKISVHNTGSHIPPDDREQIFEPFFTKDKKGGTGLGLAIVRRIVEAHSGKVWCDSDPNEGTRFHLTLPAALDVPDLQTVTIPPTSQDLVALHRLSPSQGVPRFTSGLLEELGDALKTREGSLCILIIDDESLYLQAMTSMFAKNADVAAKTLVIRAASPSEALHLAKRHRPDFIVCDLDLGPGVPNGVEIIAELRTIDADAKICIHSNRALKSDIVTGLTSGADSYLPKPMAAEQLYAFILKNLPAQIRQATVADDRPLVAVVEDNIFFAQAWSETMTDARVRLFDSPKAFWAAVAENKVIPSDLTAVITDMHFDNDEVDGLEFAAHFHAVYPLVNIVLCTEANVAELPPSIDAVIEKEPTRWSMVAATIPEKCIDSE